MARLINADALLGIIAKQERWNVPDFVYESIKNAPTIEAEPIRHGHWNITEVFNFKNMTCSYCGWLYEYHAGMEEEWNYCPHCGARMHKEEL